MFLSTPLPPTSTLVLHLSSDNGVTYRHIGLLTNTTPSKIFRRGADHRGGLIGVSLEDISTSTNLETRDDVLESAEGIARDFVEYMGSCGDGGAGEIVERWCKRFREKYKREGEFWIRG